MPKRGKGPEGQIEWPEPKPLSPEEKRELEQQMLEGTPVYGTEEEIRDWENAANKWKK